VGQIPFFEVPIAELLKGRKLGGRGKDRDTDPALVPVAHVKMLVDHEIVGAPKGISLFGVVIKIGGDSENLMEFFVYVNADILGVKL